MIGSWCCRGVTMGRPISCWDGYNWCRGLDCRGVIAFGVPNWGLDSQVAAAPTGRLSDSLRWCRGPQSFYLGYLINIFELLHLLYWD